MHTLELDDKQLWALWIIVLDSESRTDGVSELQRREIVELVRNAVAEFAR